MLKLLSRLLAPRLRNTRVGVGNDNTDVIVDAGRTEYHFTPDQAERLAACLRKHAALARGSLTEAAP
jgi:hypothetical protein